MKRTVYRRILMGLIVCNLVALVTYGYFLLKTSVPDEMKILLGQEEEFDFSLPIHASISEEAVGVLYVNQEPLSKEDIKIDLSNPFSISSNELGRYEIKLTLFGIIPIKDIALEVIEEMEVIPGGSVVGLQVETDGILVLGTGEVLGSDGTYYEPADGMIKSGDYIIEVNGKKVSKKEELIEKIGKNALQLTIERDGKTRKVTLQPVKDNTGEYKIGVWIRTDTQGIGTLTFTTTNGYFGALGHGITDVDTGVLMKVGDGSIYEAEVLNIIRGKEGTPGELVGIIRRSANCCIGTITKNTSQGIFGQTDTRHTVTNGTIAIGLKQEIETGPATILCQVDSKVQEYDIEILKIDLGASSGNKGLVIQITDEELIRKTGGIVQGMSGSPIIQNGKLIGAVTHVFIRDSTKGYGTFIENMLKQ
ncbi:MAG: SpoIVB peptidase [Lachnospiraceae bacterium]